MGLNEVSHDDDDDDDDDERGPIKCPVGSSRLLKLSPGE